MKKTKEIFFPIANRKGLTRIGILFDIKRNWLRLEFFDSIFRKRLLKEIKKHN